MWRGEMETEEIERVNENEIVGENLSTVGS